MFKIISILLYLGSLVALLVTGGLVASVLGLYSPSHITTFGPVVPRIAQMHAAWLPAVPAATWSIAAVAAALGVYLWRSRQPAPGKLQAALVVGAINYFLALFFCISLLVAYFYLPKLANAA